MKRVHLLISCILSLIVLLSPLSVLAGSSPSAELFTAAVDFSGLPVSDKDYYQKKCELDTSSALFTSGIMLDAADTIGIGADKTNFKGFYALDTDSDSKTDTLKAASYNNNGMRFTLGVNAVTDWSQADAVVLHIDNSVNSTWSVWQEAELTLKKSDGGTVSMKATDEVSEVYATYINDSDSSITMRSISEVGYAYVSGNTSGWVIIPLEAFEDNADLSEIAGIGFNFSSAGSKYTSLKEIGFSTDYKSLIYDLAGGVPRNISLTVSAGGSAAVKVDGTASNMAVKGQTVTVETTADSGYVLGGIYVTSVDGTKSVETSGTSFVMPDYDVNISLIFDSSSSGMPSRLYGKLVDLSVITAGDYRDLTWQCMLDTTSELYTKGVLVERETVGHGNDTTNFHGFWAIDENGDTVTDYLKAQPYDNTGMRFTLGFNNASVLPENREALLIRIETTDVSGSSWNSSVTQNIKLTLHDSEGGEYLLKDMSDCTDETVYYITSDDLTANEYKVAERGYSWIPVTRSGWLVVPMDMFEGLSGDEPLSEISFSLASTWYAYANIYEVGIASDFDEAVDFLTGKAPRYNVTVSESEKGSVSVNADYVREGTAISVITAPDEGCILKSVTVTETESGNEVLSSKTSFVMPACDVTVKAEFEESPYNSATLLQDVYTVTQDMSTAKIADHIDWINGPDLTPLIEQGVLIEDLERGFKDAGINNSFNGNGIYVQDDGLGFGTSLKLWTHDNQGMSVSLKSNEINNSVDYEAVVLHIHNDYKNSSAVPSLNVTLYEKGADGSADLDNPIKPKSASALYGTTVYLINDETGEVGEVALGYSAEEGATMTTDQKHYSQYYVPDGFTGYVVIPFSYFSRSFNAQDIAGIRINYNVTTWYYYSSVYDVGFTPSISNFIRITSLGNYTDTYLVEDITDVPDNVFSLYKGADKKITITVLKDFLFYYMWEMNGLNIKNTVSFDPTVKFGNGSEMGVDKFYSDAVESVYVNIPQKILPAKAKLTLDVSWDFFDGTVLELFSYNPATGAMTAFGQEAIVNSGYVTFEVEAGGEYLIAIRQLTPISNSTENSAPSAPELSHTVTNTYEVQETTGHYETIPGTKRYKTVKTMTPTGFATWFIILIIAIVLVVLAAAAVTVIIILKKKRRKNDEVKQQ